MTCRAAGDSPSDRTAPYLIYIEVNLHTKAQHQGVGAASGYAKATLHLLFEPITTTNLS